MKLLKLLALLVLTFIIFAPILQGSFLNLDDYGNIVENPNVQGWSVAHFKAWFTTFKLGMYVPLTMMSYATIFSLAGASAKAYHWLSLLLHLANVALVFLWIKRLMNKENVALCVALLFALHPFQVQTVAWISAYSSLQFTFFYLLTLLYMTPKEGTSPRLALGLLFALCAMLSKSTAVTLPMVLILLDWYKSDEKSLKNIRWAEKMPFFALSIVFGIVTLMSRGNTETPLNVTSEFNLFDRFLMVCHTLVFYVCKFFAPYNLGAWYRPIKASNGLWSWEYYAAPIVLGIFAFLLWKYQRNNKMLLFSVGFYLFTIGLTLPFYTAGNLEFIGDRYNYLPCVGFFLGIFSFLFSFENDMVTWKKVSKFIFAGISIWAIACLFLSRTETRAWQNDIALYQDLIEKDPKDAFAYYNIALLYQEDKNIPQAITHYNKCVESDPTFASAYNNLGNCYGMSNQLDAAIQNFTKALAVNPKLAQALNNRGRSFLTKGNISEALQDFTAALTLEPNYARALRNRAEVYQKIGDVLHAQLDLEAAKKVESSGK
ncbi:MAG: hypothetical protein RLZZ292_2017 [Bacteroidota bacterium]